MEKLALLSSKNSIIAVESVPNLSEYEVSKMMENIHTQAAQFRSIKKFYDDLQEIQNSNQRVKTLIDNIKSDQKNQSEFQNLSRLVAKYAYDFFDFVNFSEQFVVAHPIAKLKELLISYQYDNFYAYRLAYSLGNFVKHVEQLIPLNDFYDKDNYNIYISINQLKEIDKACSQKVKAVYEEKDKFNLVNYLDTTLSCIQVQTMCITKQIFEDENAAEYFQSTDQFIANYGFPCKIVFDNLNGGKVNLKDNDITSLKIEIAKIVNKFKIADIKIQTKK